MSLITIPMSAFNYAKQYIDQIGGQFTEYDNKKAIIVITVKDSRYQTIILTISDGELPGSSVLKLSSKVCELDKTGWLLPEKISLEPILEAVYNFKYCRFATIDNYLLVEAVCPADGVTADNIKFMVQEVASLADEFELKLTGKDIH